MSRSLEWCSGRDVMVDIVSPDWALQNLPCEEIDGQFVVLITGGWDGNGLAIEFFSRDEFMEFASRVVLLQSGIVHILSEAQASDHAVPVHQKDPEGEG